MSRRRLLLAAGTAGTLVATLAAGFTANAWAAEGDVAVASVVSGTVVRFKAAYEKSNKVVITRSGNTVTIDDKRAIKAGKGCKSVKGDKTRVRCTPAKAPTRVRAFLYRGADSLVNKTDLPMTADGGEGNDKITGGPRGDKLDGDHGRDTIYGGGGNDIIDGSFDNDVVHGGAGNDQLSGDEGADRLHGEAGNDRVYPGDGSDFTYGGDGNDVVEDWSGNDYFAGGAGDDNFLGGQGDDKAYGGAGADYLSGEQGRDRLQGDSGNDWLVGDDPRKATPAGDVLLGGSGTDEVIYNLYTKAVTVDLDGASGDDGQPGEKDTVGADVENIVGGTAADRLTGNAAANHLMGHGGGDMLRGGAGNDQLAGGNGRDTMYGEAGDDFVDGAELTTSDEADRLDGGAHAAGDTCAPTTADTVTACEKVEPWVS